MIPHSEARILIVDDEALARDRLRRLVRKHAVRVAVDAVRTGEEAVKAIGEYDPHLVFLDIQLPDLSGFDVIETVGTSRMPPVVFVTAYDEYAIRAFDVQMPELDGFGVLAHVAADAMPEVVFVTAYDEYALRAFEAHAVDYLLKPYGDDRLADAMAQVKARVQQRRIGELGRQLAALVGDRSAPTDRPAPRPDAAPAAGPDAAPAAEVADAPDAPEDLERIVVRHARDVLLVRVEDIDWIGAADYYAKLHVGPRTHLIRETMQQLERKLDPHRFIRIHRSAIVNVERVKVIQPYFRGGHVVVLHDGTKLIMSRGRRETLERALGQRI